MTNGEWLDYLAHNAPDELAAWFDAEHVETEERALDGDTDALERKSADLIHEYYKPMVAELQAKVDELRGEGDTESSNLEWLFKNDREALIDGITCINPSCAECKFGNPDDDAYCALNEREWLMAPHVDANDGKAPNRPTSQPDALNLHPIERKCGDLRRKVDELEADNDRLAKLLSKSLEEYSILEAERDEAVEAYDAHMAAHDSWHEAEDITYTRNRFSVLEQAKNERIEELTAERDNLQEQLRISWEYECRLQAERDHYRSKFVKCLDCADAIHALMDDEGMA